MHSNVVRGLLNPRTIASRALLSIISQTFTAERRVLQWWENDLLHERAGISSKLHLISSHPSLEYLFQTTHSLDWSLTNFSSRFSHKFRNSVALILTEMFIWNEKDRIKCANFPDQSQSFRFFARSSHCCKLYELAKQTTLSLDRSGSVLKAVNHLYE